MIAFAQPFCDKPAVNSKPACHAGFMVLLPDIRRHVRFAFRRLQSERREEAVQEALANALVAYVRLHELGKTAVAYASPLADYAVRQVCGGRQVACPLNSYEILSPYAQRKHGFTVNRLQRPDETEGTWKEILVEDRNCTPAELAASRLDFDAWLHRLPRHKRRIASTLAAGESTCGAAHKFKVTPGRISQVRRELAENWDAFNGEPEQAAVMAC
ncbi:MAG TPA: hypothetical protein VGN42_26385 [Pirellulales bacterium]|jgi:hypothetical protein|nr:hypothetical protein [Pirellulales bacterium]